MLDRILRSRLNRPVIGVAVAAMTSGTAFAEDSSTPSQNGTLPGVAGDYRVAKPAPEPDDAVPGTGDGQFKIGDTDVRISGSITFDVGAGAVKAPPAIGHMYRPSSLPQISRHSCACGPITNSPAAASANGRGFFWI
ncbi:MAG: hypothetical protein EOQ86_07225 [Mesorhizobium sp.]|nr:MAG: hypothetical protein EOQ85_08555 [Mesorhizobium sp.]RWH85934.1 MAG: hypothetical protein EOQ86_07225 [Mesorhizobium sp.]RWH91191.1 MAG: hypothetical protein EOQ87_10880 [Mesorhizobium sp.]RWH99873.1 MAG: hypothetical protein EOQ88_10990 [Mesorhizobium sp.]RWI03884.1 MAG: hypothetical protein EOQ89_09925 [Mesorhizobium sp.]